MGGHEHSPAFAEHGNQSATGCQFRTTWRPRDEYTPTSTSVLIRLGYTRLVGLGVRDTERVRVMSGIGEARIRVPDRVARGELIVVNAIVSHPMNTGFFRDADGKPIPAYFIKDVVVTYGDLKVATGVNILHVPHRYGPHNGTIERRRHVLPPTRPWGRPLTTD